LRGVRARMPRLKQSSPTQSLDLSVGSSPTPNTLRSGRISPPSASRQWTPMTGRANPRAQLVLTEPRRWPLSVPGLWCSVVLVRFGSLADIGDGYHGCPLHPQERTCSAGINVCKVPEPDISARQVIFCSSRHHKSGHRPSCRKSPSRRARPRRVAATSRWSLLSFPRWHSA
jgi:hypothetical protein